MIAINPYIFKKSSPVTDGLVVEFLFENNLNDTAPTSGLGTLYGTNFSYNSDRKYGDKSAQFTGDANSYILSDKSFLYYAGSITISAWVKVASISTAPGHMVHIGDKANGYMLSTLNDKYYFFRHNGTWLTVSSNAAPTTNQWVHIVGVYNKDTNNMKIYVNSTKQTQENNNTTSTTPITTGPTIGRYNHDVTPYGFNGLLDNIRIYNRALSEIEIQSLYNE